MTLVSSSRVAPGVCAPACPDMTISNESKVNAKTFRMNILPFRETVTARSGSADWRCWGDQYTGRVGAVT